MNEDAKKFRSKYFYAARRTTLPEESLESSIENLINLKSSLETSAEYKVIGKEKSVEERVQDLKAYIDEDIDL